VEIAPDQDETLILLFMCCHPALTAPSAIALTLRAVGGLTTAQIANAFLVPEATMAQRISRAKQTIKASGVPFQMPSARDRGRAIERRLARALSDLHEGYATSVGAGLQRLDLASEAIRLTRAVNALVPGDAEVAGLLALMLLTDARRLARSGQNGELVPLTEQDRSRWDRSQIEEGRGTPYGHARARIGRTVSAAGGGGGRARRSRQVRGHRLAADPGAVSRCSNGCRTTRS
jgi:predicted RNA polymerase sigma factor